MVNVIHIPDRTCMDCGKTFTATVERRMGKPVGCIYWGEFDPGMMRYSYCVRFLLWGEEEELYAKESWWRLWLHDNIPCWEFEWMEPNVKPIWRRWWLKIKELWMKHEVEMWTCHECTAKLNEEDDVE